MSQHIRGRKLGIHAKLLRQIPQQLADGILLFQDVDIVEVNRTAIGILESRNNAHQRGFAGAISSQQAEHIVADGERVVLERLNSVGICLRYIRNRECQTDSLLVRIYRGFGLISKESDLDDGLRSQSCSTQSAIHISGSLAENKSVADVTVDIDESARNFRNTSRDSVP